MQQYVSHVGQLLESALNRVENTKPFNEAGGEKVVLELIQLAVPGPRPLLARASCCWGHSSQVSVVVRFCGSGLVWLWCESVWYGMVWCCRVSVVSG